MGNARRNILKANTGYHTTTRAHGNLKPFKRARDKAELLDRFGHHLSREPTHNRWRRPYLKLDDEVKAISFNVMDNHLHNAMHQYSPDGIRKLMSRVMARGRMF